MLTTQEAAALAQVGTTAIKRWADQGLLPCLRTAGGHRRFKESELLSFLRAQQHTASEATAGGEPARGLLEVLLDDRNPFEVHARLLSARGREGSWAGVAELLGAVLTEIGRRWESGALSILDEHLAVERLDRALTRVLDSMPPPADAPSALLCCAEGDDHTLGLACAELCLREDGWNTRWAGRATPAEEVVGSIREGATDLVAASASSHSTSKRQLARWVQAVGDACRAEGIPLLLGGRGEWPEVAPPVQRLRSFLELRAYLEGLAPGRARRRPL